LTTERINSTDIEGKWTRKPLTQSPTFIDTTLFIDMHLDSLW